MRLTLWLTVCVLNGASIVGCSGFPTNVDIGVPFISLDQDHPSALAFVSNRVSATFSTGNSEYESADSYKWTIRDPSGESVPSNSDESRVEWVPLRSGRHTVSVKISFRGKSVTQTREVEVGESEKPLVSAERKDLSNTTISWKINKSAVFSRKFSLDYSLADGAWNELPIDQTRPEFEHLAELCGQQYRFLVLDADSKPYYEAVLGAIPYFPYRVFRDGKESRDGKGRNDPSIGGPETGGFDILDDKLHVWKGRFEIRNGPCPLGYFLSTINSPDRSYFPGVNPGEMEGEHLLTGILDPHATADVTALSKAQFDLTFGGAGKAPEEVFKPVGWKFILLATMSPFDTYQGKFQGRMAWPSGNFGGYATDSLFISVIGSGKNLELRDPPKAPSTDCPSAGGVGGCIGGLRI